MTQAMICLVGAQPIPNLLPIRHCKPDRVLLAYSATTERVSNNLETLLKAQHEVYRHQISPYDVVAAQQDIRLGLEQIGWHDADIVFNLTGGTKLMSLAAFKLAEERYAPIIYLESEKGRSLLYRYNFERQTDGKTLLVAEPEQTSIADMLEIEDFLKAYGLDRWGFASQKDPFEQAIEMALRPHVSDVILNRKIGDNVEIDLIIRCGNHLGIAEATVQANNRKAKIDQLNSACHPERLGTYTERFLIVNKGLDSGNRDLADAYNIKVIELADYRRKGGLSPADSKKLSDTIVRVLGGGR